MIKIEQWNEFVARWQEKECYGAEKYLHWKSQIDKFNLLAESADLLSGSLDILDISTGMGLWPYVLKERGHRVSMTDSISEKNANLH
jgi:tRNA1(Val) A37 N6-methylase TrmN6